MTIEYCKHCDASLTVGARFCGNCGHETTASLREHRQKARRTRGALSATSKAITLIFVGSLVAMTAWSLADLSETATALGVTATFVVLTAIAALRIGRDTLGHSFGRVPDAVGVGLGIAVPCVSLPIAVGYVALLPGDDVAELEAQSIVVALLVLAVLPALVEEWMCRGVLWVALRPLTSRAMAILSTAALFAALHGLNGGFVLEMPHRFVMGVLLGWLRARTASLWPCVLAHFVHNAAAVLLFGGQAAP